jgi:hypothetical protein
MKVIPSAMSHPLLHLSFALALIPALLGTARGASEEPNRSGRPQTTPRQVPGVVISHIPQATGVFIGSPSLAILPDGHLVASHDEFGPQSTEFVRAATRVFRSSDRGQTWTQVARIEGQFWSTLFAHRGALYLLGTDRHHGNVIIRRSLDSGTTWTSPTSAVTGLLREQGEYHCAPVPVLEHAGRLWRAIERRDPPRGWGITYCAAMLSVPVGADLLDARHWTCSNFLPGDPKWLEGAFGGWLEGNAVVTRQGALLDLLRVDTAAGPEKAALVSITPDGKRASFSPETGFINFPGGAKKFTIRYDDRSARYWSVTSVAPGKPASATPPASLRNTLALICSPNLKDWIVRTILLWHPDSAMHGFQYVDWLFDGDDLVAACRTAFDDEAGGAHNYHDANFLTFHRWSHFRDLTWADGVQLSAESSQP